MKKMILLSAILFITNASFAAQPSVKEQQEDSKLSSSAYRVKAHKVVIATLSLKQGLPDDYKKFLDEMSSNESKLKNGTLDIPKAFKKLNPSWVKPFLMNHVNRNTGAKFYWEFVDASNELMAHRVRRILKSYTTSLQSFEQSYANEMQKVTEEEYAKKLNSLDSLTCDKIVIEEAATLAKAIAKELEEQKNLKAKL
ncbi:MAG: hypothetical protein NTX86_05375 [Candidatus Dependentiae bacterium]|nr:hypothetical protein [Candidatus Dependentiae bacterium]